MKKSIIVNKMYNNQVKPSTIKYYEVLKDGEVSKELRTISLRKEYAQYDKEDVKNTMHPFMKLLTKSLIKQEPLCIDINEQVTKAGYTNIWANPLNEEVQIDEINIEDLD